MAGIYLHIPFCRKRCHYCDFFKSTDLKEKSKLLAGIKKELEERAGELNNEEIQTIYFGGGTPSVLMIEELQMLLDTIKQNYLVSLLPEITLEANPDDLSISFLSAMKSLGINRLSIGIQSFFDAELQKMNRRHSAMQASEAVQWAKEAGFTNISIDLIFGIPGQTLAMWEHTLGIALALDVQHISAYHLTYHEGTDFYKRLKAGILKELPDELNLRLFELMIKRLKEAGFIHYEISNFGKPDYFSRHNSAYWKNTRYLGVGPSAHSYNHSQRRWNCSSIGQYLSGLESGETYFETENLSVQDHYNEYILTGLRTIWGVQEDFIQREFPAKYFRHFQMSKAKYLQAGHLFDVDGQVTINEHGLFISDKIMSDFMIVESC